MVRFTSDMAVPVFRLNLPSLPSAWGGDLLSQSYRHKLWSQTWDSNQISTRHRCAASDMTSLSVHLKQDKESTYFAILLLRLK